MHHMFSQKCTSTNLTSKIGEIPKMEFEFSPVSMTQTSSQIKIPRVARLNVSSHRDDKNKISQVSVIDCIGTCVFSFLESVTGSQKKLIIVPPRV